MWGPKILFPAEWGVEGWRYIFLIHVYDIWQPFLCILNSSTYAPSLLADRQYILYTRNENLVRLHGPLPSLAGRKCYVRCMFLSEQIGRRIYVEYRAYCCPDIFCSCFSRYRILWQFQLPTYFRQHRRRFTQKYSISDSSDHIVIKNMRTCNSNLRRLTSKLQKSVIRDDRIIFPNTSVDEGQ